MEVLSKTRSAKTKNKGMTKIQLIEEVNRLNDNLDALRQINAIQGDTIRDFRLKNKALSSIVGNRHSVFSFRKNVNTLRSVKSILNG